MLLIRHIIIIGIIFASAIDSTADSKAYRNNKSTYEGIQDRQNSADRLRPRVYQTKNWIVREEIDQLDEADKVKQALAVYKKRKESTYKHQVWIYDKIIDQNDVYVDFITNDFNKDIVFSPNEDFVYYLEYSSDGEHKVYGVKIGTEETFFINTAEDFFIKTCEQNNTSYVITTKDGEIDSYHVFDLDGNKVQFIEKLEDIDDLKNVICY